MKYHVSNTDNPIDFPKSDNNMKKVVINKCYGGFGLSDMALALYRERAGIENNQTQFWDNEIARDCPILVAMIEELGSASVSGVYADLRIVEIPDDVEWYIDEYDGMEWVAEKHRRWD